jgi:iron complex outermembrane recepter protein
MTRSTRTSYVLASTALVALAAATPSQAQQLALEEIVVTAQKRSQNLQQIPISITAISGDELDRIDLNEIQDIAIQTPSLEFSRAGGEAQLYIRGIGTNIFGVTVDPSVAVNQDGVYLARTQMGLTQFLDVERVEVLRGPQGTLYGRNATGGAINLISRKPSDEVEGYAQANVGNFGRYEFAGAVSAPLSDTIKTRLAARFIEDDGFTKDLDPRGADEIDDQNLFAMRGTVEFDPNDDVTFTVVADWSDFTSHNRSVVPRDNLGLAESLGALPQEFGQTRNDLPTYYDWESGGITATLDWQITDGIQLKSISAYKEFKGDFLFNTDGTEIDVTRSNFQYDTDQLSQEIQLSSTDDGPFQWIAGAYYITENKYGALGLVRAPLGLSFIIPNDDEGEAYAAYVEGSYQISDTLKATAGVRYSDESKDDITTVGAVQDLDGLDSLLPVGNFGAPREASESWNAWTPRFVLEFTPNDDMLFYASATRGFKSGGFNAFDRTPSFDPEFIWSYEVGSKTDLTDRVRLNASGFYYDYSDLQVSTFINGLTLTTNAAEATVKGVEFEVKTLVTEELEFNLTGTWLDAEYDTFLSAQGINTDGSPRIRDLSGNSLINAPEWSINANANYTVDLSNGGTVEVFGQITYRDQVYFTQFNEAAVGQDDITLVDARIAYTTPDGSWQLGVYGKNIFDKEYFQNGVRFTSTSDPATDTSAIGNALGYPAPGAQYGVQMNYRF